MAQEVDRAVGTDNIAFLEELYAAYQEDPQSVPPDFREYFASFRGAPTRIGPSFPTRSLFNPPVATTPNGAAANGSPNAAAVERVASDSVPPPSGNFAEHAPEVEALAAGSLRLAPVGSLRPASPSDRLDIAIRQDRVDQLVRAYRVRGHMVAKIDPLGMPRPATPELEPKFYHLTDADIDRRFSSRTIYGT
jgi:2-oxoglutarate dehydrogenase E1 component